MSNHNQKHYVVWRESRIKKLEQIYGSAFFDGISVLECGAGNGSIGKFLHEKWGANVTFTEGRPELVQTIKNNNPYAEVHLVDHDKRWDLEKRFDFIIHWGLLYHLDNWQQDLECTVRHMDLGGVLCLESEILDSLKDEEIKDEEPPTIDDQSIYGKATHPSALRVERELKKLNLDFKRYDDSDLNADFHHYDWVETGSLKFRSGQRRFWIAW